MTAKTPSTRYRAARRIAVLAACALALAGCCRVAWADEPAPAGSTDDSDRRARALADEVLRKAGTGEDGLGDWTSEVIGRALDRAAGASEAAEGTGSQTRIGASPVPLPAERHAGAVAGGLQSRRGTAEVIVFTSLSVPAASWRQWAHEAARIGAPLVLRGVAAESLRVTVKAIGDRIGGAEVGIAIDPRLFRLFGVQRVPAVAVVPGGVPPCASRGCSDDPAPPHDLVAGNIGVAAALEAVAAEGRVRAGDRAPAARGAERRDRMIRYRCRLTRIGKIGARRLSWVAAALFVPVLLAGHTAFAEDPNSAARAIGQAGLAAAGAIARNAGSTATVPGYAGTDVPERALTAGGLEDAANARLADPDDPGGVAGRAVVEGTLTRPAANVAATDPAVVRSEGIAAAPQAQAHGASGLASGSVADCGAELSDAQAGGSCGSVRWCVGSGCESVSGQANTGFVDATAKLNMVTELGGEEFDREDLRFFKGNRRRCHIRLFGLANCCTNSGALIGLGNCSAEEIELAEERNTGNTHYLGKYCSRRTFFGVCIRRSRAWCVFGSKLGRILQEQGRSQLGVGWGDCRGLTVAEVESIDFERLDLTEFTDNLLDGSMEPSIALPEAGDTQSVMTQRIRDFYSRGQ